MYLLIKVHILFLYFINPYSIEYGLRINDMKYSTYHQYITYIINTLELYFFYYYNSYYEL